MSPSPQELLPAVEHIILPAVRDIGPGFEVLRALPSAKRRTVGPFVFLDHFGPMTFAAGQAPDVRPHPHIGLSTLSYLLEGEMVHRDSLGNVQTIHAGDVNWMTAGQGIVHSERSGPKVQRAGGTLFGQQIWVAMPRDREEADPSFTHHPEHTLPSIEDAGLAMILVAGKAFGQTSPVPVLSDLMYVDVVIERRACLPVPREHIERAAYLVSGEVEVDGQSGRFGAGQLIVFQPHADIVLRARSDTHLMLLGGEPFAEPRHVYWNFVSSRKERIEAAKEDWRLGRFPTIAGETEFIPLPPGR